jgi:2-polyprenyl-3-methyl-5-hydroxy-6-metoxy-1,4-benzoquinol methylase
MTELDRKDNTRRNKLIDYLYKQAAIDKAEIADWGCGPGNLLRHLPSAVKEVWGIDNSSGALTVAGQVAKHRKIEFHPTLGDMRNVTMGKNFDIIISVNSILPDNRDSVVKMFSNIKTHLKRNGKFIAILPSFDTTEFLIGLWKTRYKDVLKEEDKHVERLITAFKLNKRFNDKNLSYADDGQCSQCYHTVDSIKKELQEAGLKLCDEPKKVNYPWGLTKKFDYGDFPGKEEIWDWFIIAEVSESCVNDLQVQGLRSFI